MKCPIKNLESDCIETECPFYKEKAKRCGYVAAAEALEDIAENLSVINLTLEGFDL